ncbi:hypothetical protein DIS24_g1923 [Lasiodiplodia hormozganensis]|uniref:RNase MRP protein 1 RNA binding domain-containing protein n=1 Tax=Lasiodiplodia hormozganensis TaxID=869390 RepID=A0AA40D6N5_9PEZI|nr:hypothetical protein DIS24_g1923 [Lasiodiplodia hormozganensis]
MAAPAKPAAATAPPRLKPHEHADLTTFCDMLHLVHHRNVNQHRHSIWWRSFSVFRRELSHFVAEYNTYQPPAAAAAAASTAGPKKPSAKASKVAARRAAARLEAWKNDHVPRWYLAFTDVIASTQFSAIGLALLAVLARVTQITGITAAYEDEAERAMQAVLRDFAAKDANGLFGAVKADESASRTEDLGEAVGRREDFGEVVSRDDDETEARDAVAAKAGPKKKDVPESGVEVVVRKKKKKEKRAAEPEPEPEPPKKKKKTKKGKSSAIDDLFAGLPHPHPTPFFARVKRSSKMRFLGSLLLVLGVATATVAAAPVANEVHLIGPPAALTAANEVHRIGPLTVSRNECAEKCHLDDGPCLLKCMDADDKTCLAGCSNDGDFHSCVSACVKTAFPGAPETATLSQNSSCFDQNVCYNSCQFQHDSYCKVNCNYEYYWNCQHACGVNCPAFIQTTRTDVIPSTTRTPSEHFFGRPVIWLKSCPQVTWKAKMRFELLAAVVVGALVGTGSCAPATVDSATPVHTPRMIPYEVYKHIKSKQDEKKAATHATGVRRDIDLASVASVI